MGKGRIMQTARLIGNGIILIVLNVFFSGLADARDEMGEIVAAILAIEGCQTIENLSEDAIDYYLRLAAKPLDINSMSKKKLMESGLFSLYQAAVIEDHRKRYGNIASFSEMSLLDGFSPQYVSALKHFIRLSNDVERSYPGYKFIDNALTLRSSLRTDDDSPDVGGSYAVKYSFDYNGRAASGLALKSGYDAGHFPPEIHSFSITYKGTKYLDKIIAGDFGAGFGQGLALWSGFSMSGLYSPQSFVRNPVGLRPYSGFAKDGYNRGAAAAFTVGDFGISTFLSAEGLRERMSGDTKKQLSLMPGVNLSWYGMNGQASVSFFARKPLEKGKTYDLMKVSADYRYCFRGIDLFSEVAADIRSKSLSALTGVRANIGDGLHIAALVRYYPDEYDDTYSGAARTASRCSNEHGASVSFSHQRKKISGTAAIDGAYSPEPKYGTDESSFQLKINITEDFILTDHLSLGLRFSGRYRTYGSALKTELRADFDFSMEEWSAKFRANILKNKGISFLSFAECGYRPEKFSAFLRFGGFRIDNWDDRIYVYERDAPGNFNVPAYYGRGVWLAFYSGIVLFKGARLYLRASYISYPWLCPSQTQFKPGRAELKCQIVVKF